MKHAIQICHPNEMIEGKWKSVGFVASRENLTDVIESPDFEIYNGLLFRCGSFACFGAFSDARFLDLGSESKLMNKLRDAHLYGITKSTNFISFWRDNSNPASLCAAVNFLMTREHKIRFCHMCATTVKPYISQEFHHLIDAPSLERADAETWLHAVGARTNDYTNPQINDAFQCLFSYLCSMIRDPVESHMCLLRCMGSIYPQRDRSIAQEAKSSMRQQILIEFPFHEVIQCVLNSEHAIRS